jgi:hypothetical protein
MQLELEAAKLQNEVKKLNVELKQAKEDNASLDEKLQDTRRQLAKSEDRIVALEKDLQEKQDFCEFQTRTIDVLKLQFNTAKQKLREQSRNIARFEKTSKAIKLVFLCVIGLMVCAFAANDTGIATYDADFTAPFCQGKSSSCDSGTLLAGRHTFEENYPNTIDSCTDGSNTTANSTESVTRIKISSVDRYVSFC